MARIKTYPIDTLVTDKDIIIGSDADVFNQTKNFKAETLRDYILSGLEPIVGGNLKITTITATDEINLTPEDYFNNLEEPLVVLNYEIIFLILNGRTYIFRQNGNTYGIGETQTTASDFTEIDITSIINANLQDLDSVLTEGNESLLNASVGALGLWDGFLDNYGYISCIRSKFNFTDSEGFLIGSLIENTLLFNDSDTVFNFQIKKPAAIADNRIATFQNASGVVAYTSDIPSFAEVVYEIEGGTAGTQPTFTGAPLFSGSYIKTGSLVHFQIQVDMDNITNFGTGQYYLTLPFESKYGYMFRCGCLHDFNTGREYHISGHVYPNSDVME